MTDREKLIELLREGDCNPITVEDCHACKYCGEEDCSYKGQADNLIANNVVIREKGEWEIRRDNYDNEFMWCHFCQSEFYDGDNDTVDQKPNFCPNCGADMRQAGGNRNV